MILSVKFDSLANGQMGEGDRRINIEPLIVQSHFEILVRNHIQKSVFNLYVFRFEKFAVGKKIIENVIDGCAVSVAGRLPDLIEVCAEDERESGDGFDSFRLPAGLS